VVRWELTAGQRAVVCWGVQAWTQASRVVWGWMETAARMLSPDEHAWHGTGSSSMSSSIHVGLHTVRGRQAQDACPRPNRLQLRSFIALKRQQTQG